ncbi:quinoprotein dehydrogenase-associated SoxYZ-like carrier [Celeribacter neptunius]|uniref:Sulfur-oxidizing protein SoxY n=1 Tax=Celeribacter neptunius TaxID=588602 RepID=A0A1I3Y8K0_9RHOB|nr:quinoprotein dehydrogenase-associated SoxYZ-like carrier [Celeribacter neptunius]SFK28178.1 sulfur-oxidizing protein SoxY [Celeribacter neptunius]
MRFSSNLAGLGLAFLLAALPALAGEAGEAWDNIRFQLYGERPMLSGKGVITLEVPYRTDNDARTEVTVRSAAPAGTQIAKLTLVLDENPMPVSAVFALHQPQTRFSFGATLRVNGPTPIHVVAEMRDGRLFMIEDFVKTSGQGACAAPPGTDPDMALVTLGDMLLSVTEADPAERLTALGAPQKQLDVDISHPSHSGMQMDQITLLFIPMRYVEDVEIAVDGGDYVDMTGSISLSENPRINLSIPGRARGVDVTMTDTDGTISTAHTEVAGF